MTEVDIAKQSARGSLVLLVGRLLSTAVLAISSIIVARLLGPDQYGAFALVLLIPALVQLFTSFGIDTAITRYVAFYLSRGDAETAKRMAVNAIAIMTISGFVFTLATLLIATYFSSSILHREDMTTFVQYASVLVLAQTIFQLSNVLLIGWGSMGLVSVSGVLQAALKLSISVSLVVIGLGVFGALIGHLLSILLAGVLTLILAYAMKLRRTSSRNGSFTSDVRTMVSYGRPVYAGGILSGFAGVYITIILAASASNSVVGFYQAASNVAVPIGIISSVIATVLFPSFAGLEGIKADTSLAFRYATKYVAYLVTPVVMFVAAAAGPFVQVFYGPAYLSATQYLRLIAISNLPIIIGQTVIPSFLNGIGRTRLTFVLNVVAAVVVLTLAPVLGTGIGLGVEGLIYSLLASNLLSTLLGLVLLERLLDAGIEMKSIVLMLLASLITSGLVYVLEAAQLSAAITLVLQLAVFAVAYLTFVPLFRAIGEADLERLSIAIEGLGPLQKLLSPIIRYEQLVLRIWK